MLWFLDRLAAYVSLLCRIFNVTPDSLGRGRRGNLPPAQGASVPVRWI